VKPYLSWSLSQCRIGTGWTVNVYVEHRRCIYSGHHASKHHSCQAR